MLFTDVLILKYIFGIAIQIREHLILFCQIDVMWFIMAETPLCCEMCFHNTTYIFFYYTVIINFKDIDFRFTRNFNIFLIFLLYKFTFWKKICYNYRSI